MNRLIIFFLPALIWLCSCTKKETPQPIPSGLEYYPVGTNRFIVYEVDSVVYVEIPKDTVHYRYQIKERISEEFTDNEGKPARKLERFIKLYNPTQPYDQMSWKIKEVWMLNADTNSVQLVENNVRYTKLVFPVISDKSWQGNAHNDKPLLTFRYVYTDVEDGVGNKTFNEVAKVQELEEINLISHKRYYEKYAKNIGLVERVMEDVQSNNIIAGKTVMDRIEKGFIYSQKYVTHGIE